MIRSTIERLLPVRDGEAKLSPTAREILFDGYYFIPSKIIGVDFERNNNRSTRANYPITTTVTRETSDGRRFESWQGPITALTGGDDNRLLFYPSVVLSATEFGPDVRAELEDSSTLARATRVEKIARRIKVALGVIGVGAVLWSGVGDEGNSTQAHQNVDQAMQLIEGAPQAAIVHANALDH